MRSIRTQLVLALAVFLGMTLLARTPAIADAEDPSIAQHTRLAAFAVVLGIRGLEPSSDGLPARLSEEAKAGLKTDGFTYETFQVHSIHLEDIRTVEDRQDSYRVLGLIIFEDFAGRRAYVEFAAFYDAEDDGVNVTWASQRVREPSEPAIVWYAIDNDDLTADLLQPSSHLELLRFSQDPSARRAGATYTVVAVVMDRFPAAARPGFEAGDASVSVTELDFGGWTAGIFRTRLGPEGLASRGGLKVTGPQGRPLGQLDGWPNS